MRKLEEILALLGGEKKIDYSLERFCNALKEIENPEKSIPSLVVAGTNGKGSTSLYLSSALKEHGYRVATYLSPHLQDIEERFLNNLRAIDRESLEYLANKYLSLAYTFSLTYFEFLTLLFFIWVKEKKFDFMVLEVGLGGRLDATNVTKPLACILTTISYDHESYLGNTLESILNEKMGILKNGTACFSGLEDELLNSLLEEKCKSHSISLKLLGKKNYQGPLKQEALYLRKNAALAKEVLNNMFPKISETTIEKAFSNVLIPARMEWVNKSVLLSVDHNLQGIEVLLEELKRQNIYKPNIVCAFSPDKPYKIMYEKLKEVAHNIILTKFDEGRKNTWSNDYFSLGPFEERPEKAILDLKENSRVLLITGSCYLAGQVRKLWKPKVEFY